MCDLKKIIKDFFSEIQEEEYVLIKKSRLFPNIEIGDDLDIFCINLDVIVDRAISAMERNSSLELSRIEVTQHENQAHVDLLDKVGQIVFRFDIRSALPKWRKVSVKKSYFYHTIFKADKFSYSSIKIKVPCLMDDWILRYIEYLEYFSEFESKINHVDHILQEMKINGITEEEFVKEVSNRLEFPISEKVTYDQYPSNVLIRLFRDIRKAVALYRRSGLKVTLRTIFKVLKFKFVR